MQRIKLPPPTRIQSRTTLTVRASDLNYGNHLANDAMLRLLQEARLDWLDHHGLDELGNAHRPGIMLCDVTVCFTGEAFLHERLIIDVGAEAHSRTAIELRYAVREHASGRPIATARTTCVFFDYHNRKVTPMPQSLSRALDQQAQCCAAQPIPEQVDQEQE
ncbi:thioesterase family protein [Chitiniphilus purpureus]|uniref:Thioesterase family protein n=1 Tax=Chitiniphilus purpureus TaxID=2981137 RepID=A0ABY6DI45_9NEIS|nr:thioesterase family protein [Chitiniphilus sp. CD1]UXY14024.1 thioesterase family protein [Chitiniphilus sp. CD1]